MACALRSEDGTVCPAAYECTAVPGSTQAVCCPSAEDELMAESSEDYTQTEMRPQTSKLSKFVINLQLNNVQYLTHMGR